MRIVVVGATGNIGTSTLRALAADPSHEIVGIARRHPELRLPNVQFVEGDVARDDFVPTFEGADAVIHLAWMIQPARDTALLQRVNVDGSRRVFEAAIAASVPSIVYASSVGAYARGPKDRRVKESWPTRGIRSSLYSMQKARVERILDELERVHPQTRVVRMRPALVFKRQAASELRRLFLGPFVPQFLFGKERIPFVPDVDGLRFQIVHSHDVGNAFALAAVSDVRGAFNLAAEPVLDPDILAEVLNARRIRMPAGVLRWGVQAAWRLHLTPTDRGWIDLGLGVPLMDTSRARNELGWSPQYDSTETLVDLLEGLRNRSGMATAPLHAS